MGAPEADVPFVTREKERLPRDRFFEPYRVARTERAKRLVSEIVGLLEAFEARFNVRQRRRKPEDQVIFEQTIEAIVCDVAHRHLLAPGEWIAISLSHKVLARKSRYRPKTMGDRLPHVVSLLRVPEIALIEVQKGYREAFFGGGRASTIRASVRLEECIRDAGLEMGDFARRGGETIVLKERKEGRSGSGKLMQYADTTETVLYREQMASINDWLAGADIDFDHSAAADKDVDHHDRFLRRTFNNGSFQLNGRLFGGFWQRGIL